MLTADRDSRRRGEEGTGEVESLHGRMKGQKMGDRLDKGSKPEVRVFSGSSSSSSSSSSSGSSVLSVCARSQHTAVVGLAVGLRGLYFIP